jgi:hypothetical protein
MKIVLAINMMETVNWKTINPFRRFSPPILYDFWKMRITGIREKRNAG